MGKYVLENAVGGFVKTLSKGQLFTTFLDFITRKTVINQRLSVVVLESDDEPGRFCNCANCNGVHNALELIDGLCAECFVKEYYKTINI